MRRPDPVLVVGAAMALITAIMMLAISVSAEPDPAQPPTSAQLQRAVSVCPVDAGATSRAVSLAQPDAAVDRAEVDGATLFTGTGRAAPGLIAGQWTSKPASITDCAGTSAEDWFVGVGAGPRHRSIVQLINPSAGQAVVDLTLSGPRGPVQAKDLLGIVVPASSRIDIDLGQETPMLGWLTLHAQVVRGRVSIAVDDRIEGLGGGLRMRNWLPPQLSPRTSNLLLQDLAGSSTLVLTNPTDQRATAQLSLVTEDSVFAPAEAESVVVPAGATTSVDLSDLVDSKVADGSFGLVVDSDQTLVTGLRSNGTGVLRLATASETFTEPAGALLPPGPKSLLLAGATNAGSVLVESFRADGRRIGRARVAITPDAGARTDLADGAERVVLTPTGTSVSASIVMDTHGVVGIAEPGYRALLPRVRPDFGG